jgi:predicted regulator of Ras-like GTPase activity (Roadblock/LC7/MglB family)
MLTTLVERAPGARGAVFCDSEGESVELVLRDPELSEYDMKVFGAQLAAVWLGLQTSAKERGAGALVELRVRCAAGSLICRSLPDGYYVVLLIGRGAATASAAFELRAIAAQIASAL